MKRKFRAIVQSNLEPDDKQVIWLNEDYLRYYNNGEWVPLGRNKDDPNITALLLNKHISNKQNPHSVTKAQVGLSNVTNDSQVKRSEMGANNGVATLDTNGKVLESQLPAAVTYAANLPDNIVGGGKATATENGIILSLDTKNKENGDVSSKDILIPNADGTKTDGSGLMLNSDKTKLDSINATKLSKLPNNIVTNGLYFNRTENSVSLRTPYFDLLKGKTQYTNTSLNRVDSETAGVMTAADKVKLDSLSNYTLPIADSSTLGGIKIGSGLNIDSNGTVSVDNKLYILVNSLESVSTPDANKIYLVLNSSSTSETNSFTEYVWITSDTGNKWEKLGEASATVDLADYYTKTEINNKLSPINNSITELNSNKVDKQDVATTAKNGLLSKEDKTKLDGIETGANKYVLPEAGYNVLGGIKATSYSGAPAVGTINTKLINQKVVYGSFSYNSGMEQVLPTYGQVLEATIEKYGLMSPEDKIKLNNINVDNCEYLEGTIEVLHSGNSFKLHCQRVKFSDWDNYEYYDINIPIATNSACGLLSKEDKVKLDNLSSGGSSNITEYTEAEITALLKQIRF